MGGMGNQNAAAMMRQLEAEELKAKKAGR